MSAVHADYAVTQSLTNTTHDTAYLDQPVRQLDVINIDSTDIIWVHVYPSNASASAAAAAAVAATDIAAEQAEAIPVLPLTRQTVWKKNGEPAFVAVDAVGAASAKFTLVGSKLHM